MWRPPPVATALAQQDLESGVSHGNICRCLGGICSHLEGGHQCGGNDGGQWQLQQSQEGMTRKSHAGGGVGSIPLPTASSTVSPHAHPLSPPPPNSATGTYSLYSHPDPDAHSLHDSSASLLLYVSSCHLPPGAPYTTLLRPTQWWQQQQHPQPWNTMPTHHPIPRTRTTTEGERRGRKKLKLQQPQQQPKRWWQ